MFTAKIEPDLRFLGFNLYPSDADGSNDDAGWYFVIQERPGEPRFGLDIVPERELLTWNDLSWQHFPNPDDLTFLDTTAKVLVADPGTPELIWGANAADMASILHQPPVIVAVHAANMLEGLTNG
jgi:hypothetical protein